MNKNQIQQHNESGICDTEELLNDLKAKSHIPYLNSVIVADGLYSTAIQIMNGFDKDYHTTKLTPYQRQVFVWAYLEILTSFIEYALEHHGMPEAIFVPK